MVTLVVKRQAAAHLCASYEVSQRRACQVIAADRSSMRYRGIRADDVVLRRRLRDTQRRRFGHRRLLILIRREGMRVNHKKLRHLYREGHL
jgi:putative transposase